MTELNEANGQSFDAAMLRTPSFEYQDSQDSAPRCLWSAPVAAINQTIETEIIPRLVMAHSHRERSTLVAAPNGVADQVGRFAEMIMGPHHDEAAETIQSLRDRGVTLERIYLDLMVPAARHLRHLWTEDYYDYADVTLGLWRLQQLLRSFSAAFCADAARPSGLRALLSPSPGEKRELGFMLFSLTLASEFFRRGGWDAWIEPDPSDRVFTETVQTQWFDVVEFFATSDKRLDDLATSIRLVRRSSPNPAVGVMVSGPAFTHRPELVLLVGGDAVVSDFAQETIQARNVVNHLSVRR